MTLFVFRFEVLFLKESLCFKIPKFLKLKTVSNNTSSRVLNSRIQSNNTAISNSVVFKNKNTSIKKYQLVKKIPMNSIRCNKNEL